VFINTQAEETLPADVFNFDNYGGTYRLTRHLLDNEHRRIAHVRGPELAWDAAERTRGYRDAMREAQLESHICEVQGGYTRQSGYESVRELLECETRPSAIVAANDYCATGVLSALHEAGIDVPGDISVCGFDGLASSQYTVPPLATVSVPIREIGERAVKRLISRLDRGERESPHTHEIVPVHTVDRQSIGRGPRS
jgi:LacI family transcriptional regulator